MLLFSCPGWVRKEMAPLGEQRVSRRQHGVSRCQAQGKKLSTKTKQRGHGYKGLLSIQGLGHPKKCLEAAWEGNVWVQAMGEAHQSGAGWDVSSYPSRGSSVWAMGPWGHHPSWHPLPRFPATWHSPGVSDKPQTCFCTAPGTSAPCTITLPCSGGQGSIPRCPPHPDAFPPALSHLSLPPRLLLISAGLRVQTKQPPPHWGAAGRFGTQTTQQKRFVFCCVLKSSPGCPRAAPRSLPSSLPSWVRGLPCSALFTKPWIFPSSRFCILAEPPWPSK